MSPPSTSTGVTDRPLHCGNCAAIRCLTRAAITAREDNGFAVALADGRTVRTRRLLVATGLVDELPDIPGLRDRWGQDVVHCPYCHGWEIRDQAIGVLGSGLLTVHQALLFRQWSADVMLFSHTMAPPTGEEVEQLAARGISVVDGEVASLQIVEDRLVGNRAERRHDGQPRGAGRRTADDGARRLPCSTGTAAGGTPVGAGRAHPFRPDRPHRSTGVWVAGNVTDLVAQVGTAAAAGAAAAARINADLIAEETRQAVAAYRDPFSAESEARVCELVTGDRRHGL